MNQRFNSRKLAFCAIALAIAFVTSYIKFLPMPYGGTLTLCSMLFIVLTGYWYGPFIGIIVGFVFGILQFIQEPYVLTIFQVCCDYFFAFAALGFAGFYRNYKNGLTIGYIFGILARGAFHVLGGYLYWMEYMPENFPKNLAVIYPFVYNYSYILGEGILTLIIINIPAVKKALESVSRMALADLK